MRANQIKLWMCSGHLLESLSVPADQQRPGLQQDAERVLLHPVKELLERRSQLAVHLPPQLLIHINGSLGGGEEIGGVKELRGAT